MRRPADLIPHRPPWVCLDRLVVVEEERGVAGKRLSAGDPWPGGAGRPPGLLVVGPRGARAAGVGGGGVRAGGAGAPVLRHVRTRGGGAALEPGSAWADPGAAPAVLSLDAAGQHDPADAPALVAAHRAAPDALVIGVRTLDAGL